MKALAAVTIVVVGASVCGLREDDDSRFLKAASERLDAALQKAAVTYDEALRRTFDAFNSELESAIRAAEKRNDLETAARLRDAKRLPPPSISRPLEPADDSVLGRRRELTSRLIGTTWTEPNNDEVTFQADGSVVGLKEKQLSWEWVALDESQIVVRYPGGWLNVFQFNRAGNTYRTLKVGKPSETELVGRLLR